MPNARVLLATMLLVAAWSTTCLAAGLDLPPPQPGIIEGVGTRFEVPGTALGDLVLEAADPIQVRIESAPEGLLVELAPAALPPVTRLRLAGLTPGLTLHLYDTDLADHQVVVFDAAGAFAWEQDLTRPHLLLFQPRPSTIFLDGSGWSDPTAGEWDPVSRVATLTRDLTETLQISGTGLILDGAGHRIDSGNLVGVYVPAATDIGLRRLRIGGAAYGLRLYYSGGVTATCNEIEGSVAGIDVFYGSNLRLIGNTVTAGAGSDAGTPLRLRTVKGSEVGSNRLAGPQGLWMSACVGNVVRYNRVTAAGTPLSFVSNGWNNTFYNNTFASAEGLGPLVMQLGPNVWSQGPPAGGNYWAGWTAPDADADGFVDEPFAVAGLVDSLPYAAPDGWAFEVATVAGAGGAIVPCGPLLLGCGATQQFVFEPEPGSVVVDVLVDGVSMGPMGAYTLTGACEPHTVEVVFGLGAPIVAVAGGPGGLALSAVGPNPSRGAFRLSYTLPERCRVRLAVYDARGSLVAELEGGTREAGAHGAVWERDGWGAGAAGLYFARLEATSLAGGETLAAVRKLVRLP